MGQFHHFFSRGLRFKVMLTVAVTFFIFAILLSGFLIQTFYLQTESDLQTHLSRELQSAAYSISAALEFNDKVVLRDSVRFFRASPMCCSVLIREVGKPPILNEKFDRSSLNLKNYPTISLSRSVYNESGRVIGEIEIVYSLKDLRRELTENIKDLMLLAFFIAILALISCAFLLNKFLTPLGELKTAIDEMSDKNYIGHVNAAGSDEIYDLARSFNKMSDTLRATTVSRNELALEVEHRRRLQRSLESTQKQLLQSEKMAAIGQLAAGVAHEINNPAGFVLSNLELLKQYVERLKKLYAQYDSLEAYIKEIKADGAIQLSNDLEKLRNEMEINKILADLPAMMDESIGGMLHISRIVMDLRTFSHSDERKLEKVDIRQLLDSTLNIAWNTIKYKAEVVKDYGDLPTIYCYPQQLSQVFLNLLINAAQAISQKGIITIRTFVKGAAVIVEIEDTGTGMTEDVRGHLFEPFFTTKPVGKGTGLGLSIAYNIIEDHKGQISAASRPGGGSIFTIRLPQRT
ncbi:MAG: HAMP domain-containing protein [Candidatus Omnitrophica bacterium]|nr:HAMP domain-containing protein [Candidatus Omnitrophota bacterium]